MHSGDHDSEHGGKHGDEHGGEHGGENGGEQPLCLTCNLDDILPGEALPPHVDDHCGPGVETTE